MKRWSWPAALRCLAAAALAAAAALPCRAQAAGRAAVELRVIAGKTGEPLAGASIRMDGVPRGVSDSAGRAVLSDLEPGRHLLDVSMPLRERHSAVVEVFGGQVLSLDVELPSVTVALPPVMVGPLPGWDAPGAQGRPGYRGIGRYFGREHIMRSGARRVSELLVMEGVLQSNGRMRGANCEPRLVADRQGISGTIDFFPVQDLEAVQVFSNGDVPPEFGGTSAGTCGVVAVWTRHK